MRTTTVTPHLSGEELLLRKRTALTEKLRERWHLIWLVQSEGYCVVGASVIVGHSRSWGHHWIHLYSDCGPEAIEKPRKKVDWVPPKQKISQSCREELYVAVNEPVPDEYGGGEWSGPRVMHYIREKYSINVGRNAGWRIMQGAGLTLQTPRPTHAKANPEEQLLFKEKILPERIKEVRTLHPNGTRSLWFMDEARFGLLPIIGKKWSPKGKRPRIHVQPRYQWQYVYSAVNVESGKTHSLILPTVNLELMQTWIDTFSAEIEQGHVRILVMDGAGWHSKTSLTWPENVYPVWLPPYSPELNPTERLWTHMRKRICNHRFVDLNELIVRISRVIEGWLAEPWQLASMVNYGWISDILNQD